MNSHGLGQGESIAFRAMDQSMVTCFLGSHQNHEKFANLSAAEMKLSPSWKIEDFPGRPVVKASTSGSAGSISSQGTKILHATQCDQKKKGKKSKGKKKWDWLSAVVLKSYRRGKHDTYFCPQEREWETKDILHKKVEKSKSGLELSALIQVISSS